MGRLTAAIERLRQNRFVVLGRAGIDFTAEPAGTPQDKAERFFASLGGSAANIAAALSRHGAQASLISVVSDDAVGRFTLNALHKFGIGADHVRVVAGEFRTTLAVVDMLGDDTQSVIYRNHAADFALATEDVDAVTFADFGALIVTGTALTAEPSRSAALGAIDRARAAAVTIVLDVDYRPYSWPSDAEAQRVYSQAAQASDIVIGNDLEFGVMAGGEPKGEDFARQLAAGGDRLAVYKMGAKGALTFDGHEEIRAPIFKVTALKPTGAGDAFMGGLMASLGDGRSLPDALRRGSASAAIVVTRIGCSEAMPTLEEVDAFIRDYRDPEAQQETPYAHSTV